MENSKHPPHRAHESPLTFLRSRSTQGGSGSTSRRSSLSGVASDAGSLNLLSGGFGVADFMRETAACLSGAYGERLRTCLYEQSELEAHETLDTLAVRRLQTWFSWTRPAGSFPSATQTSEPRQAVRPDSRKSYVLKLKDDATAEAVLTQVVERIAATVPFLGDPNNCWSPQPGEMNLLLSSHVSKNDAELAETRRICLRSSPIDLRLANLVWRRNGTLWAQWRVAKGNVDRLRADLRVASGASVAGTFSRSSEDPTRGRPFVVESLVLAVLHKPSSGDFRLARSLTEKLSTEFKDTPFIARHVYRLRSEMSTIDRSGLFDVLPLMKQFPGTDGDLNRVLWGIRILQASPSVRRILATGSLSLLTMVWLMTGFGKFGTGKLQLRHHGL